MIVRIVKMTFEPNLVEEFLKVFEISKEKIRSFEGCTHLELMNDVNHSNIYFTYSYWRSEDMLDTYRNSDLFTATWAKTKKLFSKDAEAWTLKTVYSNSDT